MPQGEIIAVSLFAAFLIYITARGVLPNYLQLII